MIGPVIGAVVLTFLPEVLRGFGDFRLIVYGLALTLVALFMPGGILQAWQIFDGAPAQLRGVRGGRRRAMSALLEAKELRKSFGGVKAVQGISLSIPEHSIYAVIGPNGAGKSTMMNLLSVPISPTQGNCCSPAGSSPGCRRISAYASVWRALSRRSACSSSSRCSTTCWPAFISTTRCRPGST
jgi:hypothetical protein